MLLFNAQSAVSDECNGYEAKKLKTIKLKLQIVKRIVKFNERNKRDSYVKNLYSITKKLRRKISGNHKEKGKTVENLNKRVSSRWGRADMVIK